MDAQRLPEQAELPGVPHAGGAGSGLDKKTAEKEIGVYGAALTDDGFTDKGSRVRYSVTLGNSQGPYEVTAELWYQPIGFRWANNLKPYRSADEPRRFTSYYDAMGPGTAVMLARAVANKVRDTACSRAGVGPACESWNAVGEDGS